MGAGVKPRGPGDPITDEDVEAVRKATPESHPHGGLPAATMTHLRQMKRETP